MSNNMRFSKFTDLSSSVCRQRATPALEGFKPLGRNPVINPLSLSSILAGRNDAELKAQEQGCDLGCTTNNWNLSFSLVGKKE